MTVSLSDLIKPLSADQVFETLQGVITTLGVPVRSWARGGVMRTMLRVFAQTAAGFTELMSSAIRSGFLDFAAGDWLTLLGRYVYGVERTEASFAQEYLTLTNTGGGNFTKAAETVRAKWTIGNKEYVNAEAFTLAGGESKRVLFRAVELGVGSSAPPGQVNALVTVMPFVTATNAEAFVGVPEQTDEDLRQTCRDRLGALSAGGPRGAYAYAARVAKRPDGSPVDINRISVSRSSSTGVVTVVVGSAAGAPSPSDLQYIRESIEVLVRPDSVTVEVVAAIEKPWGPSFIIWARSGPGITEDSVRGPALVAIAKLASTWPIGGVVKPPSSQGYFFADKIAAEAIATAPTIIVDVDNVGGDLALAPREVAVVTATATVRWLGAA